MEGCHVIISISQNPNPNFLLSFHPPWQPSPSPRRKLQNHHRLQQRATVSSPSSRLCATVLATTTDRASTIATPFPSSRNSSYAATTMPFHLRSRATNAAAMAAENADLHRHHLFMESALHSRSTITTICTNQRRHALHPRSAQQQQLPTPCLTSHHLHPCENPEATPPRRKSDRRAVSRAVAAPTSLHETLNAANPSLERESALCATC